MLVTGRQDLSLALKICSFDSPRSTSHYLCILLATFPEVQLPGRELWLSLARAGGPSWLRNEHRTIKCLVQGVEPSMV